MEPLPTILSEEERQTKEVSLDVWEDKQWRQSASRIEGEERLKRETDRRVEEQEREERELMKRMEEIKRKKEALAHSSLERLERVKEEERI